MTIDLHIHSIFSDGTQTPTEIATLAQKVGITSFAITDHDTVDGVPEALAAAKRLGIEAVSGIELSVVHGDHHLHLLGYFFDHTDLDFQRGVKRLQEGRDSRNRRIIENLRRLGIDIDLEEVETLSRTGQTGRPHIAQILRQKGVVKSIDDAFEKYLKRGAPAYAPRFVYDATTGIELIKSCGGVAILAHPMQTVASYTELGAIVDSLAKAGLDGLELYYPGQRAKVRKKLRKIVKKHAMVFSGGSDYHGSLRAGTGLAGANNVYVPPEVVEELRCRRKVKETAEISSGTTSVK